MTSASVPIRLLAVLVTALIAASGSAAGEYYSWRDERGNLVMSDRPPKDPTIAYTTAYSPWSRRSDLPDVPAFRPADDSRNDSTLAAPEQAPPPAQPDTRYDAERCAAARERLFKLENLPRIRLKEEDGEIRFLSIEERREHEARNRELVERYCKD